MRAALKIIGFTLVTGLAAFSFMSFMAYVGPGGGGALDLAQRRQCSAKTPTTIHYGQNWPAAFRLPI